MISQLILPSQIPASQPESPLAWAAYQRSDICDGLACMSVADAAILRPAASVVVDSSIKFTTFTFTQTVCSTHGNEHKLSHLLGCVCGCVYGVM